MNRCLATDSKLSLDPSGLLADTGRMTQQATPIEMERRRPEQNMARFYSLAIERDLFDTILARRTWGRIGTKGRSLATAFPSLEAASAELRRLEQAKRRRGYVDRPDRSS